jgi:hypothetical protein
MRWGGREEFKKKKKIRNDKLIFIILRKEFNLKALKNNLKLQFF